MHNKLIAYIRRRSREEWLKLARSYFEAGRKWTQENGEWAAGIAFIAGVFIVLAFQLFLILILVLSIAALVVWQIALPGAGSSDSSPEPREGQS